MAVRDPWYEGISPEHRATAAEVLRLLDWGVKAPTTVSVPWCDAVLGQCRRALETDRRLLDLVRHVFDVAYGETHDEFEAHGPTTRARLWADLSDRLEALTELEAGGEGDRSP